MTKTIHSSKKPSGTKSSRFSGARLMRQVGKVFMARNIKRPTTGKLILAALCVLMIAGAVSWLIMLKQQSAGHDKQVATFSFQQNEQPLPLSELSTAKVMPDNVDAEVFSVKTEKTKVDFVKSVKSTENAKSLTAIVVSDTTIGMGPAFVQQFSGAVVNSSIVYKDVYPSTDIIYTNYSDHIKEEIVLRTQDSPKNFAFDLTLPTDVELTIGDNGGIIGTKLGQNIFYIHPLTATDRKEKEYKFHYQIEKVISGYTLEVIADQPELLAKAEYPVIIDPTISWDFSTDSEYVLSDPTKIEVVSGVLRLKNNAGVYAIDNPYAITKNPIAFTTLSGFTQTLGANNQGSAQYQISKDGTIWYYWNGSAWAVGTTYAQSNTSAIVNTNIATFVTQFGAGSLYFKIYLHAPASSNSVELDSISATYTPSLAVPTIQSISPNSGNYGGGTAVTITGTNFNRLWLYRKLITIDETKIPGTGSLENFPILISRTDADLKSVSNGGKVAKVDGADIKFTLSDGITKLNHQIEKYNPATGELVAWVNIPFLSKTVNTTIYIHYGNAAASSQQNVSGTWGTNQYRSVWHMNEYDMTDTFTGTALNSTRWTAVGPGSVTQNERVAITTTNAQWAQTWVSSIGKSILVGDFDIQVDTDASGWPAASPVDGYGQVLALTTVDTGIQYNTAYYLWTGGYWSINNWHSEGATGGWGYWDDAAKMKITKLRIARSGATLTSYIWKNSAWVQTGTYSGARSGDPVYVDLAVYNRATGVALPATYFDNFLVTKGVVVDATAINNGTSYLSPSITGKIAGGRDFNGTTSVIGIPYSSSLNVAAQDFSVGTWVNSTQAQAVDVWPEIISNEGGNPRSGYNFGLVGATGAGNNVNFGFFSGGTQTGVDGTVNVRDGTWHHVVATKTSTQLKIYVDGVLRNTTNHSLGSMASSLPTQIGRYAGGVQSFIKGSLDELRVYTTAISDDRVAAEYANQNSPATFYSVGIEENPVKVTLGGAMALNVTVVNATTITAVTPFHTAGLFNVAYTNPDGQIATLSNGFTYTSTGDVLAPTIPSNVTLGSITHNSITVSWTASTDAGSGLADPAYYIERAPDVSGSPGTWAQIATSNTTSYIDTGLSPSTRYYYRIRAKDNGSNYSAYNLTEVIPDVNTVGLWHMNETSGSSVADSSTNGYTGTATGTTIVDGKYNKSRQFNGTTNFVGLGTQILNNSTAGTLQVWVKPSANGVSGSKPYWNTTIVNKGLVYAAIYQTSSNKVRIYFYDSSAWQYFDSNGSLAINQWNNIAYSWSSSGSSIYINGVLDKTSTLTWTNINTGKTNQTFDLGGMTVESNAYYFPGIIDELHISNKVRSAAEIAAASLDAPGATTLATPPILSSIVPNAGPLVGGISATLTGTGFFGPGGLSTDANTAALWHMNETSGQTIADSASSNITGTATGTTVIDGKFGKGRGFNGTSDYIAAGTTLLNNPSSGSIEMWVKPTANGVANGGNVWQNTTFISKDSTYMAIEQLQNNKIRIYYYSTAGAPTYFDSSASIPINTWSHVAYTWDITGSKIYINGVLDITSALTWSSVHMGLVNQPFEIGRQGSYANYFTGYLDEMRVSNYVRSAAEILASASLTPLGVTLGGNSATNVVLVNATTITATVPTHTAGTVDVVVTNPDGQTSTLVGGFVYNNPPTPSSITPSSVAKTGGDSVTISGLYFAGTPTVTFGGVAGTVTSANATTIIVNTPAHAIGGVNVVVTNPDGQNGTLVNGLTYLESPPTIISISPTAGPPAGGIEGTITGTNFELVSDGYTKLLLHGDGANNSTTFKDSGTPAKTVTPNGGVKISTTRSKFGRSSMYFDGSGDYLTVPDSEDWNLGTGDFTIDFWINFDEVTTKNFQVILEQRNDANNRFAFMWDKYNGLGPRLYIRNDAGILVDVKQGSLTGWAANTNYHVAIVRSGNNWNIYRNGISIASASDADGPANFTGSLLMASNIVEPIYEFGGYIDEFRFTKGMARWTSNFTPPVLAYAQPSISIGGNLATNMVVDNSTTIRATIPAHAAGLVDVVVNDWNGTATDTLVNGFSYNNSPIITSINPASVLKTGGDSVTIAGSDFVGTPTVTFGGIAGTVTANNATTITVNTPAHAVGSVDVVVTNPDGQSATRANGLAYTELKPTLSSVSPNTGPPAGGLNVTITGNNFMGSGEVIPDSNTVGLWHFNETSGTSVVDSSNINSVGTATGTTIVNGEFIKARQFNGTGDYVRLGTQILNTSTAGTLQVWVKPTANGVSGATPYNNTTILNKGSIYAAIQQTSSNKVRIYYYDGSGSSAGWKYFDSNGTLAINQWNNIAYSWSSSGSSIYLNGILDNTSSLTWTNIDPAPIRQNQVFDIGGIAFESPYYFSGNIDELHISNKNRSAAEIAASSLYSMPVTFGGVLATNVIGVNSTTITATIPAHTAGVVDVVVTNPDGQTVTLANGFTYNMPPSITSISPSSVSKDGGEPVTINGLDFVGTPTVTFGGTTGTVTSANATTIVVTTPAHVVGVVDVVVTNPDEQIATLANGLTFVGPPPIISSISPNTGPTVGGRSVTITGSEFYSAGTDSNTKLLLHGDGTNNSTTFIDSASTPNSITANGNAKISTTKSKFGGSSMSFDGDGDYLSMPANNELAFGTGDFTIDFWFNTTAKTRLYPILFANGPWGANAFEMTDRHNNWPSVLSVTAYNYSTTGVLLSSTTTPVDGTWYHVAVTRSGNIFRLFVNGVQEASTNWSGSIDGGTNPLRYLGYDNNGYNTNNYNGNIEEFRVSKGIARWTTNFTPPISSYAQSAVTFGGTSATNFSVDNSTTITATIPAHTSGVVDVVVTNPDGQYSTLASSFTYRPEKYGFISSPLDIRETQPGAIIVSPQDINGNVIVAPTDITLNLSTTSQYGFFARNLSENESTRWNYDTVTIPAGQSSTTFYYKDNLKGAPTITVSDSLYPTINATQIERIRSQFRFLVTGITNPVKSGIPSSVFLQVVDYLGNPVNNAYPPISSILGTAHFTSTDPNSALPADFTFTPELLGRNTFVNGVTMVTESSTGWCVTATDVNDADITGQQCGIVVTQPSSGAPYQLKFINSPQSFGVDSRSSAITVQMQDLDGIPVPVETNTPIYIYSTSPTANYSLSGSSDWQTANPYYTLSIAAHTTSGTFYYKDSTVGTANLTAKERTDEGIEDTIPIKNASQDIVVGVGGARKLVLSDLSPFTVGTVGGPYFVSLQDINGNVVTTPNDLSIYIRAESATAFIGTKTDFSDGSDTLITTIPAGGTSRTFYYTDTRAALSRSVTVSDSIPANGDIGLLDDIKYIVANPASITKFKITSAPFSSTAGSASPLITLESRDQYNNASPVSQNSTVYLSASGAGGQFSTTSNFAQTVSSVNIAPGSSTTQFYFKQTIYATTQTITVSDSTPANGNTGIADDSQVETITAGSVSKLVITSPSSLSGTVGAELGPITIKSQNNNGVEIPVTQDTPIYFYSTSTGKSFSLLNGGSWSSLTQATLAQGASSLTLFYKDTKAGSATVTVSDDSQVGVDNGLSNTTIGATLLAGSPTQLKFTSTAQTLQVGQVSGAITVALQDQYLNTAKATSIITVNLNTSSLGKFDTTAGGAFSGSVTSVTIPINSSTATFYYKDLVAGTPLLTVSATGLTEATQQETINWGAVTLLQLSTTPTTITAGAVSSAITVKSFNSSGIAVPVSGDYVVALSSNHASTGKFDISSGGSFDGTVTQVTIPSGVDNASFYFKDTLVGSVTLTGGHSGATAGTVGLTINSATGTQITYSTSAQTLQLGQRSGAVTVQVRDAYGNATTISSTTISLTTTSVTGRFLNVSNQVITSVDITSTASFYYQDFEIGSPIITATLTGFAPITQTETINEGAANNIWLSTASTTLTAGQPSSVITVTLRNAYDQAVNATTNTSITLSDGGTDGGFDTVVGGSYTTTAVTILQGQNSTEIYYKNNTSDGHTITATKSGLAHGSIRFNINPDAIYRLVFTNAVRTTQAGLRSNALTIGFRDVYGNTKILDAGLHLNYTTEAITTGVFATATGGPWNVTGIDVTSGSSGATFYYKDTLKGTPTLTVSATDLVSATQQITINGAAVSRIGFATAPQTIVTQNPSAVIQIQAYDAYDNLAVVGSNTAVSLSSSSTNESFSTTQSPWTNTSSVTMLNGQGTASFYYKDNILGTPTITVSIAGISAITQNETIIAGSASKLMFTSTAQTIVTNTPSQIINFSIADLYGNAVPPETTQVVTMTSSGGGSFSLDGETGWSSTLDIEIIPPQVSAGFYFSSDTVSTPTLTIASPNLTPGTQMETVINGSIEKIVLNGAPSAQAGQTIPVVLQTLTNSNLPVAVGSSTVFNLSKSNTSAQFSLTVSPWNPITTLTLNQGQYQKTIYFRDTTSGMTTIGSDVTTHPEWTAGTAEIAVDVGAYSKLAYVLKPVSVLVNEPSTAFYVQTQDQYGNVTTTGATVYLFGSSSSFAEDVAGPWDVTSLEIPAGVSVGTFYYKDSIPGTKNIVVSDTAPANGNAGIIDATTSLIVIGQTPTQIKGINSIQSITAGIYTNAITLEAEDPFGNPTILGDNLVINLQTTSPSSAKYSAESGSSAPTITQITIPIGSTSATVYYTNTKSGIDTLTFSSGSLTSGSGTITVGAAAAHSFAFTSAPQTKSAGAISSLIKIEPKDIFGNSTLFPNNMTLALTSSLTGEFSLTDSPWTPVTQAQALEDAAEAFVYYQGTTSGTHILTVDETPDQGLDSGSQNYIVTSGSVASIGLSGGSTALSAGQVSTAFTATLHDAFGNVSSLPSTQTFYLYSKNGTGSYSATSNFTTIRNSFSVTAGQSTFRFFYKNIVESNSIVVVSDQSTLDDPADIGIINGTQNVAITWGSPSNIYITGGTTTAAGVAKQLTLQLQNSSGIVVPAAQNQTLYLYSTSLAGTFSDGTGDITQITLPQGQSSVNVFYTDTASGTPTITVSDSTSYPETPDAGLINATSQLTITSADLARFAFLSSAQSLETGQPSSAITVQAQDIYGNAYIAGSPITAYLYSSTTGVFSTTNTFGTTITQATILSGASTATFYYKDQVVGSPTITVSESTPLDVPDSGLINAHAIYTISAGNITKIIANPTISTVVSGGVESFTIHTQNQYSVDTPVLTNTTVYLFSSSTGGQFATAINGPWNITQATVLSGSSTQTLYYRDSKTGSPTITVSDTAVSSPDTAWTNLVMNTTITAGVATQLRITTSAFSITAKHTSPAMIVEVQNQYGSAFAVTSPLTVYLRTNATDTATAQFSQSTSGPWGLNTVTIPTGSSQATFYYHDSTEGTPTITVDDSLDPEVIGLTKDTQQETIARQVLSHLLVTNISTPEIQGEPSSAVIAASDSDGYIIDWYDGTITFSSSDGDAILPPPYTFIPAVDKGIHSFGNGIAFLHTGIKWVKAIDQNSITGTQFNILVNANTAGPITKLRYITPVPPVVVNFDTSSQVITVQARDTNDRPSNAPTGGFPLHLASSSPTGQFATSVDGPWSDTGRISISQDLSSVNFYYKDTVAGTGTITVSDWINGTDDDGIANDALAFVVKAIAINSTQKLTVIDVLGRDVVASIIYSTDFFGYHYIRLSFDTKFTDGLTNLPELVSATFTLRGTTGQVISTQTVSGVSSYIFVVDPIEANEMNVSNYVLSITATNIDGINGTKTITIPVSGWVTKIDYNPVTVQVGQDVPFTITTKFNNVLADPPSAIVRWRNPNGTNTVGDSYLIPLSSMTKNGVGQYSGTITTTGLTAGDKYSLYTNVTNSNEKIVAENSHHDVTMLNNPALAPKNFNIEKILTSIAPNPEIYNLKFTWDGSAYAEKYNLYRTRDKNVSLFQDPCTIQQIKFGHRYGDVGATTPFCETTIQQHDGIDDATDWVKMAEIPAPGNTYTIPWAVIQSDLPNNTYYYLLRAENTVGESAYSTMSVSVNKNFNVNTIQSDFNWISIPYTSKYNKISDIVADIEGGIGANTNAKIKSILLWRPSTQNTSIFSYNTMGKKWTGIDSEILPGDGVSLQLSKNTSNFNWTIVGSDSKLVKVFSTNLTQSDFNWMSLPYTSKYQKTSDIVADIEGGIGANTNAKIKSILLWRPSTQNTSIFSYNTMGKKWTGIDSEILPGDGVSLQLSKNTAYFDWNLPLIINPYK